MNCFYLLKSEKDAGFYKGSSANLAKRLDSHRNGRVKSTKNRRPLKLVHHEEFDTYAEALAREKYYKTFEGGKELAKIVKSLDN